MRSFNLTLLLAFAICTNTLTYAQSPSDDSVETLFSSLPSNVSVPDGPPPQILTTPSGIQYVRTPESAFSGTIKAYPAPVRYLTLSNGLRMAYTDSGYPSKGTFLLIHGEPDWGYLFRRMIPIFASGGYRVVVPDLIGFGRSDKPTNGSVYTYPAHTAFVKELIDELELSELHTFLQDWGGPIGLTIAAENPGIFKRLALGNTLVPNGTGIEDIREFREFVKAVPVFNAGALLQGASQRNLSSEEIAAYNAPFPSDIYTAGARRFPFLVTSSKDEPGFERFMKVRELLKEWREPVLLQWGLADLGLGAGFYRDLRGLIPGTDGQPHQLYPEASHFIQEDVGVYIADGILRWLKEIDGDKCEN